MGGPWRQLAESRLGTEAWPCPPRGAATALSLSRCGSWGPRSGSWLRVLPSCPAGGWGCPCRQGLPLTPLVPVALLTTVSFGARFSPLPHGALGARLPTQSSLALLSWVAGDSFGSSGAWGSHISRTPRDTHGTRRSRGTHGPWGTWGPSWSLGPLAAGLSEGVEQKWVPMLGDPGMGRSNRSWGTRGTRRPR